jgi:hypothetical protein
MLSGYNPITKEFGFLGIESGAKPYTYRDTFYMKLNYNKIIITRLPVGRLKANDTGLITSDSIAYLEISGKPVIPTNTNQLSNGSGFITSVPAQSWTSITGKPTTLSGYGITDAYPLSGNPSGFLTSAPSTNIPLKDKSGLLTNSPVFFTDTFTIASSTPTISLSTYLSAASKSSFKMISCDAYRASATASNIPTIIPTALSSNSITFLLTQTNTSTVTILGINVLNGLPVVPVSDPQNVKVILSAYFY